MIEGKRMTQIDATASNTSRAGIEQDQHLVSTVVLAEYSIQYFHHSFCRYTHHTKSVFLYMSTSVSYFRAMTPEQTWFMSQATGKILHCSFVMNHDRRNKSSILYRVFRGFKYRNVTICSIRHFNRYSAINNCHDRPYATFLIYFQKFVHHKNSLFYNNSLVLNDHRVYSPFFQFILNCSFWLEFEGSVAFLLSSVLECTPVYIR